MNSKREHAPASGDTPGKPGKKMSKKPQGPGAGHQPKQNIRKTLFGRGNPTVSTEEQEKPRVWCSEEIQALIQYIGLYWDGAASNGWPNTKDEQFWECCANAIAEATDLPKRSGSSCRTRVTKHLKKAYPSLCDAEDAYGVDYFEMPPVTSTPQTPKNSQRQDQPLSPIFGHSPSVKSQLEEGNVCIGDIVLKLVVLFKTAMTKRMQLQLITYLLKVFIENAYGLNFLHFIHGDIVETVISGVYTLYCNNKKNLLYIFSKILSEDKLKLDRMPFGLIDYNLRFFHAESAVKLEMEHHYAVWQETMLAHFGHKWIALNRGPMWQYDEDDCTSGIVKENVATLGNAPVSNDILSEALAVSGVEDVLCDVSPAVILGDAGNSVGAEDVVLGACGVDGNTLDVASSDSWVDGSASDDVLGASVVAGSASNVVLGASVVDGSASNVVLCDSVVDRSALDVVLCDSVVDRSASDDVLGASVVDGSASDVVLGASVVDGSASDVVLADSGVDESSSGVLLGASHISHLDTTKEFDISTLWSNLSSSEVNEILQHGVDPSEMDKRHGLTQQKGRQTLNSGIYKPGKALVNIAGLGPTQLKKKISLAGFSRDASIQVRALKNAHESNPCGRWWIKADACDVRKGLRESVKGKWAGDEDLNDGELEKCRAEYQNRKQFARLLGLKDRSDVLLEDLRILSTIVDNDLEFLREGEVDARTKYEKHRSKKSPSEALMMGLAWDLVGFQDLLKQVSELKKACLELETAHGVNADLQEFRTSLLLYTKQLFMKKRVAATHLMVFMIADESRNRKPYALPVQVMPFKGMKDSKLRELYEELRKVMVGLGMTVVGFVTDGEFNSLRTMGSEHPISILQLISDARQKAKSTPVTKIAKYLRLNSQGIPLECHPAVPLGDVLRLQETIENERITFEEAILLLRKKMFPEDYEPCTWVEGKDEDATDCLKSIMAIYLFRHEIKSQAEKGIDFRNSLVVPEVDAETQEKLHQREDHNHLLKRIVGCLREGSFTRFQVKFLRDALHDPDTGLTYEALTGKNKQSVPDCERLISKGVISFMEKNCHHAEAKILSIIHNWHKAVDGRGLNEETRAQYCKDMMTWLLKDWMPYLDQDHDYSTIDVNRPIKGICGLTREIIVGLVANLETRQQRREEYTERDLPPEHPRASSTDDVEGIIALFHEVIGVVFDTKEFYDEFPKIMNEFSKKSDPNLPFYYWTGSQTRYRDFPLPSFNKPSKEGVERLDRVTLSRRGDPGVFVADRASLPQKNQLTVRANFHRAPVPLPPIEFDRPL